MKQMKHRFFSVLISLTVLFSQYALALPAGSYRQTCGDCYFHHHRLTCHCLTKNQFWVRSTLKRPYRCDTVTNHNGNLTCQQVNMPRGSYRQTCGHCQFNGKRLACDCLRANQTVNFTVLHHANRCHDVQNMNGRLACFS